VGRSPNVESLKLEAAGVRTSKEGHIVVDEYQTTNVPSITALGDVCGKVELTPVMPSVS
jgi:glutathione reductase (NADPH)